MVNAREKDSSFKRGVTDIWGDEANAKKFVAKLSEKYREMTKYESAQASKLLLSQLTYIYVGLETTKFRA